MSYNLFDLYEVKSGMGNKSRKDFDSYKFDYHIIMFKEIFYNTKLPSKKNLSTTVNLKEGELERFDIKEGDVLLTSSSETSNELAMSSVAFEDYPNTVFSGFSKRLRPKTNLTHYPYMRYWFRSDSFRNQINSFVSMTTRANLNNKILSSIKVKLPNISKQIAIANILSSLDDKIETNKKINQRLEDLAQTLYKRWFVDFEFPDENGEPYKSSGGEMVQSELGLIPKGWKAGNIGDLVNTTIAGDWGKADAMGNHTTEVVCIRGADINSIKRGNKGKCPTRYILEKNFKKKKLKAGDIVIEISGGSPTQSTGRTGLISQDFIGRYNDKVICTNFCRAIEPKDINSSAFISLVFNYLYNNDVFFNYENGTTGIKNLDLKFILDKLKIVLPNKILIDKIARFYFDIYSKIQKNGKENENLRKIRETLLPKLINGEIEVPIEE